jgi:hypothetical protein
MDGLAKDNLANETTLTSATQMMTVSNDDDWQHNV